jgi:hypothetical protein
MIDVLQDLFVCYLLNGFIQPQHEVLKRVHVVLDRMRRVVTPLEVPPPVHDRIRDGHLSPPFL